MRRLCVLGILALALVGSGCATQPTAPEAEQLTVGKVQGEIQVGLPSASVVEILGSPNIITTDEKRREVWVYDKVSSNSVDTSRGIAGGIIILGGSSSQRSRSQTQRTLTIIIKYDEEMKVRDFAYNYSQF